MVLKNRAGFFANFVPFSVLEFRVGPHIPSTVYNVLEQVRRLNTDHRFSVSGAYVLFCSSTVFGSDLINILSPSSLCQSLFSFLFSSAKLTSSAKTTVYSKMWQFRDWQFRTFWGESEKF